MKTSLLQILACPVCHSPLKYEGTSSTGRLVKGFLRCKNSHLYQVKEEIPIIKDPKMSRGEFVWNIEFPNLQTYDDIQKKYRSYLSGEQREADKLQMEELVSKVSQEDLVLDVASGRGRLLLALSKYLQKEANVLGTDVDEKPLRGAKLKLEEQDSYNQVSLCVMDGKHLAIRSRALPCVTSYWGLDSIPETKKAFQEVSRVLMSKGRLVLATLWFKENSKSLALAERHGYGDIVTENRLTKTLEETGFKLDSVQVFYSGKWPHNPMDLLPVEDDWFAHALVFAHKA